jgi:hypothetical protein
LCNTAAFVTALYPLPLLVLSFERADQIPDLVPDT